MFKFLIKKGLVVLSTGALLLGAEAITANAGDFEARYVHHAAGHGANQTVVDVRTKATGKNYVLLNCTYFKQQIPNQGYLTEASDAYKLTAKPVYKKGSYKIYYANTSIPRKGTYFTVNVALGGYSDSNPMTVRGNM